MRGGGTRAVGATRGALAYFFHLFHSRKNLTIGLLWLVTRGGWAPESSVGATRGVCWFHFLGSLKNFTFGLIWLVTRRGGAGGGVGGVGQGGGQGGDGGWAPESSVRATRSFKNLPIGLIWLVTRGAWGGGVGG